MRVADRYAAPQQSRPVRPQRYRNVVNQILSIFEPEQNAPIAPESDIALPSTQVDPATTVVDTPGTLATPVRFRLDTMRQNAPVQSRWGRGVLSRPFPWLYQPLAAAPVAYRGADRGPVAASRSGSQHGAWAQVEVPGISRRRRNVGKQAPARRRMTCKGGRPLTAPRRRIRGKGGRRNSVDFTPSVPLAQGTPPSPRAPVVDLNPFDPSGRKRFRHYGDPVAFLDLAAQSSLPSSLNPHAFS